MVDAEWRGDDPGEMGDALPLVDLGANRTVVQVAAGSAHTCALLDNGKIKCWGGLRFDGYGDNNVRQMGDSLQFVDIGTGQVAVQLVTGNQHTCVLLDNAQMKCWGSNVNGELGYGDTEDRGVAPDQMGDNLTFVDLGIGRTVVQVIAGNIHTCSLLDNAQMKCWGNNRYGSLGYGDTQPRGQNPNEMGDNLPFVDLGTGQNVSRVACATLNTCALLDTKQVKCWGSNNNGQLGYGDRIRRGDGLGEMGDALNFIDFGTPAPKTSPTEGGSSSAAASIVGKLLVVLVSFHAVSLMPLDERRRC